MVAILIAYITTLIVAVVCFAYFKNCDPLYHGDITKGDQVSISKSQIIIIKYCTYLIVSNDTKPDHSVLVLVVD